LRDTLRSLPQALTKFAFMQNPTSASFALGSVCAPPNLQAPIPCSIACYPVLHKLLVNVVGAPACLGMRIRVSDILEMLSENVSTIEILEDFPDLEPEDIQACLLFAAKRTDFPRLVA
jgi:uncharacterized protein (DUF433 family)